MRLVGARGPFCDVGEGRDPKHIMRDVEDNDIVYIRGEDALEAV